MVSQHFTEKSGTLSDDLVSKCRESAKEIRLVKYDKALLVLQNGYGRCEV